MRERAVDLRTGKIRPREVELSADKPRSGIGGARLREVADPTVYARVDYLDSNSPLPEEDRTIAPSGAREPARGLHVRPDGIAALPSDVPAQGNADRDGEILKYACIDTCDPATYQIAYILHPATLWDEFGPIRLSVHVPKGMACQGVHTAGQERFYAGRGGASAGGNRRGAEGSMDAYTAALTRKAEKSGQLFIAVEKAAWDAQFASLSPARH